MVLRGTNNIDIFPFHYLSFKFHWQVSPPAYSHNGTPGTQGPSLSFPAPLTETWEEPTLASSPVPSPALGTPGPFPQLPGPIELCCLIWTYRPILAGGVFFIKTHLS